jgi:hypothetical protein
MAGSESMVEIENNPGALPCKDVGFGGVKAAR